jgi:hypothetical protein
MKHTEKQLKALEKSEQTKRYVSLRKTDNTNGYPTGRTQESKDKCTTLEQVLARKKHREKVRMSR